ncbi:MAG: adenylate/guanylate cyclase domain-containing protein, partial [Chloroflexota bacterium]|nr:adenylate/guanylate cyclase domain-containing protein [Chloroflexota bacterium]
RHGGVEVDTQGDAFFVAFPTAHAAVAAAREAQQALAGGRVRVRMGIHTGTPHLTAEGYVGSDVHRAARIAAAGHGGQILVSAATATLLGTEALRDLGEHRLKDLLVPERIHQVGSEEFPALKSLHLTNLPVPATAFVGRDEELDALSDLVRRADVRLVTLTGAGGTGKTRLALQVAGTIADAFEGGVWWVPLAAIRDPQLVMTTAARSLGAQGDLANHIGDKQLLILFDNFEQVTAASPDIADLLERCPGLKLLVTSREPLRVHGEWEFGVDPLRDSEAVALFTTRAVAARRDFSANGEVRQICLRLDNLPLAIELAAARVRVLSPRAMLARLEQRLPVLIGGARDAPERQRTLRATIEWSHDLLSANEQRLFARLSVFNGGCTLESAEEVADADLDTLQSLVDKSLVRHREDRFWMLETIREFAGDRLEASGELGETRRRHALHFLALAEEAHPKIAGHPGTWLSRLEAEHDNFRAAIDRLAAGGENEVVARLCGELWPFWYLSDHVMEATRRCEDALDRYLIPDAVRAKALNGALSMACEGGDTVTGRRHAEEALAIHEELGEPWALANSRFLLAQVSAAEGDWPAGRDLLEDSVRTFAELGDSHMTMLSRRTLAWMYEELGDEQRYRALTEENYRQARAAGNKRIEARAQACLADFVVKEGRVAEGLAMYRSSLRLDREVGDKQGARLDLYNIAEALSIAGDLMAAATLLAAVEAWRERSGVAPESWRERMNKRTLEPIHAGLAADVFAAAWARGAALTVDEAVELAMPAGS